MRAPIPSPDPLLLAWHFEAAPGIAEVRKLAQSFAEATPETVSAVLDEAVRFASERLEPLNLAMDSRGIRLADGRVRTAPGHAGAWAQFIAGGWPTLDHATQFGGQELPLALGLAVQEVFDRACPSFGMMPVAQRSAARLIAAFGSEADKAQWLPGLASGVIGATICISETGAGSDVMQMTSRASQDASGRWTVTGEKCWISYGDHDLTDRIVHCVLARTDPPGATRPEVSLFLVEGAAAQPGRVVLRRIEEKLGLHGSPTCSLGFEGAAAVLLGEPARGLAQMFVMITQMRLSVGAMGLGIASAAADLAIAYASERRQGGPPGAPRPIDSHPDVRRQLLEMDARAQLLRALILTTANVADMALRGIDADQRKADEALVQYLLPIIKTAGADAAFHNSSGAIQVLGGAGYTREWPAEQLLRDARVLSVFEGTSGIQALDLLHRRVLRDSRGFVRFLALAREAAGTGPLATCLDRLEDAAGLLGDRAVQPGEAEAGASAFLDLAILAALGWTAARLADLPDDAAGLVRSRRLELPRAFAHNDLNVARLPVPPRPQAGIEGRVFRQPGLRRAHPVDHRRRSRRDIGIRRTLDRGRRGRRWCCRSRSGSRWWRGGCHAGIGLPGDRFAHQFGAFLEPVVAAFGAAHRAAFCPDGAVGNHISRCAGRALQ
jgi:3-(methylthio)propanoyl-CoA dehydrogenase